MMMQKMVIMLENLELIYIKKEELNPIEVATKVEEEEDKKKINK